MLKDLFNRITKKSTQCNIEPNVYSQDYQDGMRMVTVQVTQEDIDLVRAVKSLFHKIQKSKTNPKENIYSIKINTSANCLSDEDFINIVKSFREIAENFCDLFKIGTDNMQIKILSASSGCFNINFGINFNIKEFNILKFPSAEIDLISPIVEFLTHKKVKDYEYKPVQLIKDCITGYITKKIPEDNEKIKYIDRKKSNEAKKTIIKTIQKQPNTDSVVLDGSYYMASELDLVV